MSIRALLADDHQIVRQGLRVLLEREGLEVVGEAADGRAAVNMCATHHVDVAVLDLSMPELNGLDAAREILHASPSIGVILLTVHTDDYRIVAALRAGVRGYIVKTQAAEELVLAVREVAKGGIHLSPCASRVLLEAFLSGNEPAFEPLTPRERQVLQLVAEGKTTKEIAVVMGLSVKTAESYRGRLMQKLNIHETAGLVRYAIRHGLVQA